MKQMYRAGFGLAVVLSLSLFSCKEDTNVTDVVEKAISDEEKIEVGEVAKLEFSKALAKALQENDVRAFLKNEALSQYDGDYDVLYALVKNKTLANGETFEQRLSKHAMSADYKTWSERAPLMTIFVPDLKEFSVKTWDLNTQIPDVVIDNSHLKEKPSDKLVAISSDLKQYEVDSKVAPSFPVVVIKENERIIAKSKLNQTAKKTATLFEENSKQVINENDTHSFYFIGDVNPKTANKNNARTTSQSALDVIQSFNYHKSQYPNEPGSQRDWVYYRIWPKYNDIELVNPNINGGVDYDWSKGVFGDYYSERITGFKFDSALGIQAVTDSWTEGNLEFHLILAFIHRDGGITTDTKVFFCTPDQLRDSSGNPVNFNPNTELMAWDIYRYGDEWKFSVMEHDAGGSTTKTVSAKSNFGLNFEVNATILKIGAKFGASATFEKSNSTVVMVNSESDQLGDARILFDNPVIIPGGDVRYTFGTGAVNISIEPVLKINDPRPYPYVD
ncbi:hypothetical protein [Dyadobacter sp. CY356]|uniref:hypothetical protein n=1 Tax=Dyadobacter sp. CY356 TaxID=2906442 RepID=UPI001F1930D9|nr:hypothetical protein [Dyadobacter sp. CY356]MCF0057655.1 hypothetical protein [Dyadobacter sp. CY356]